MTSAPRIDLSNLTAAQGFVIQGDTSGDQAGRSVSSAGDVNGDGFDDLIVGATGGDDGGSSAGEAYVIYGQAGTTRGRLDLSNLTAAQGFIIQGDADYDRAGFSVSSAGDVNDDGIDDLIVGAPKGDDGGYNAGEAYVIYGQAGATRGRLDLSNLTVAQGFVIQGDAWGDRAGWSVSSAGDVSGDGIDDLIAGASGGDDGGKLAGEAYVIYGQVGATRGRLDLSNLTAAQGFVIQGDAWGDYAGRSVSSAGDVNGDGTDDLIVGAPKGDDGGSRAGEAYVIYGQSGATRGRIDLSNLTAEQGFVIQSDAAFDEAGWSVSSAGDLNGDGIDDLIVGAPYGDDGGYAAGAAYVIYGQSGATRGRIALSNLTSAEGFVIQGDASGDYAGFSVSSAGDVNGDGFDDLIVGAPGGDDGGEAYVIYGRWTLVITGTAQENSRLTAVTSVSADAHGFGSFNYQWFAGSTAISGATGSTFTPDQAQVGQEITVRINYTDSYGTAESLTSSATTAVLNVNDAPRGAVTVTGTPRLGQVLTTDATAVADPDGINAATVTYQWLRDGVAISGATDRTYAVAAADLGRDISVRYGYTDSWGTAESLTSAAVEARGNRPSVLLSIIDRRSGEDGSVAIVAVMLETAPVDPVTITFAVSDGSEARLQTRSLTFTSANWNVTQTLTITGVDDYDDDGNVAFNLTGTISTEDLSYTGIAVPTLSLINADDGLDSDLKLYGTNAIDDLTGNNGDDRIYGAGNLDQLRGGRGDDRLYGQEDDDRLYGDEGEDWLYGGYDDDRLFGDAGDDELYGEAGADTLSGGDGNDLIDGGTGADRMLGNSGNDTYYVNHANDVVIDGGMATDVDTVVLLASITYTLSNNVENASLDDSSGDAGLTGNQLDNLLSGNAGDNALTGGGGSDTLTGGGGGDTLYSGEGNDTVDGGAGSDLIVGGNGAGDDLYRGGAGVDTIRYSSATAGIIVNLETGTARSATGNDAGIGKDRLSGIEAVIAGRFNDVLTGNSSANQLSGAEGRDRLVGQAGADQLNGGAGADSLIGGAGKDRLTGGAGADVFVFSRITETGKTSTTRDVITDFARGIDDIDLQAIDANTARTGNQAFTFIGIDAFTGTAGQLRFANGIVSGDVNGDRIADFSIAVNGMTALAAGDLIL